MPRAGVACGMPSTPVSHTFSTPRHTTHYLECGPADGPLILFLHGWPEIGLVWRAQMKAFARKGGRFGAAHRSHNGSMCTSVLMSACRQ